MKNTFFSNMTLLNKISIWFIAIILLVTPITMYISYTSIKNRLDMAEVDRLISVNRYVENQLKGGKTPENTSQGLPISVEAYNGILSDKNPTVIHTCDKDLGLQRKECKVQVNSYANVNGQNYKISSYNYVPKTDDILKGMMNAVVSKMLLVILIVAITARILSKHILRPFRHAIDSIHNFRLKDKKKLELLPTTTREFKELNAFLKTMTDKAVEDYALVKEFSENASHELQTPLAVMQSKLELLADTTHIDEKQASLINDMQTALDRLSRVNYSLILMTKLDNREFSTNEELKFCTVVKEAIAAYSDRMAMKGISLLVDMDKDVRVKIHPSLAEILVNNVLGNSVRHNREGGVIQVQLAHRYFQVVNPGSDPGMPTYELFKRFKKSKSCDDSIGLGLSIVKRICKANSFSVYYDYIEGWHALTVYFDAEDTHVAYNPSIELGQTTSLISPEESHKWAPQLQNGI